MSVFVIIPRDDPAFLARFWAKVDKSAGPDGCWPWAGLVCENGYGRVPGISCRSHRIAWIILEGPIAQGMCVLHRCDNPPCCNPKHLWLGTQGDNMKDRDRKGRQALGERRGNAKLDAHRVLSIRSDSRPLAVIALHFGVSRSRVSMIKNRKSWTHLP